MAELHISELPGLKLERDFIPPSTQFIKAQGNTIKYFNLAAVTDLNEFRAENNTDLKLEGGKLPLKLSIFAADHVEFNYKLNCKDCDSLCFLIVGKAEFIFGEMKELAHLRIGDAEVIKG